MSSIFGRVWFSHSPRTQTFLFIELNMSNFVEYAWFFGVALSSRSALMALYGEVKETDNRHAEGERKWIVWYVFPIRPHHWQLIVLGVGEGEGIEIYGTMFPFFVLIYNFRSHSCNRCIWCVDWLVQLSVIYVWPICTVSLLPDVFCVFFFVIIIVGGRVGKTYLELSWLLTKLYG